MRRIKREKNNNVGNYLNATFYREQFKLGIVCALGMKVYLSQQVFGLSNRSMNYVAYIHVVFHIPWIEQSFKQQRQKINFVFSLCLVIEINILKPSHIIPNLRLYSPFIRSLHKSSPIIWWSKFMQCDYRHKSYVISVKSDNSLPQNLFCFHLIVSNCITDHMQLFVTTEAIFVIVCLQIYDY